MKEIPSIAPPISLSLRLFAISQINMTQILFNTTHGSKQEGILRNTRIHHLRSQSVQGNGGDVGENTTFSLVAPTGVPSNRTQDKLTRVTDVKAG